MKYPDDKKDANPNAHANAAVTANGKTSEYIINAFSYTLRKMTSNWCHNYLLEFLNYIFLKLTQAFCRCHWKTQNYEQSYIKLKNIK